MDEAPLEELLHISKKKGNRSCTLCMNHGIRTNLKGHKRLCPFLDCNCELCVRGRRKRGVMRKQVSLRRKQMKDIGNRSTYFVAKPIRVNLSPAFVETESPFTEEDSTFDEREEATKHGGINGGLIENVSNILHSQLDVARQHPFNYSAYVPTPYQLQWTIGGVFSGFHHNNWRPDHTWSSRLIESPSRPSLTVSENSAFVKYCNRESSSRKERDSSYVPTPYQLQWTIGDVFSGFHHNSWRPEQTKPRTSPNFTVSDNSPFVKYCNLSPRMEGNSLNIGGSSSVEAAAVLASVAGNQKPGTPNC